MARRSIFCAVCGLWRDLTVNQMNVPGVKIMALKIIINQRQIGDSPVNPFVVQSSSHPIHTQAARARGESGYIWLADMTGKSRVNFDSPQLERREREMKSSVSWLGLNSLNIGVPPVNFNVYRQAPSHNHQIDTFTCRDNDGVELYPADRSQSVSLAKSIQCAFIFITQQHAAKADG